MFIIVQLRAFLISIFLGLFLVLVCLFAIPFRLNKRLKLVGKYWEFSAKFALRHGAQAQIVISEDRRGHEFLRAQKPGVYVANHQSFIDIPMLVTKFQIPPIMKKEVLYVPFVGLLGWICGAIPVSRSNMKSKRKVLDLTKKRILVDGMGVQVYPEGTRSKTGEPAAYEKIARALLVLAFKEKIPVVPVSIYGTREVVTDRGRICPNQKLGLIIHQEIYPEAFTSADEFSRACWSKVVDGYSELKNRIALANKS